MTAKEFLEQVKSLEKQIGFDKKQLVRWKEVSFRVKSGDLEPNYNATRSTEAPYVRCVENTMELEQKIDAEIAEFIHLKEEVLIIANQIGDLQLQDVLEYRYLDYCTWDAVAKKMGFTKRWVQNLHKKAIEKFEEILKKTHSTSS